MVSRNTLVIRGNNFIRDPGAEKVSLLDGRSESRGSGFLIRSSFDLQGEGTFNKVKTDTTCVEYD